MWGSDLRDFFALFPQDSVRGIAYRCKIALANGVQCQKSIQARIT